MPGTLLRVVMQRSDKQAPLWNSLAGGLPKVPRADAFGTRMIMFGLLLVEFAAVLLVQVTS